MSTTIAMETLIGHHVTGWRNTEWQRTRGTFDGVLEAVLRDDTQCPCRIRADDGAGVMRSFLAAMYTQPPELLEWLSKELGLHVLDPFSNFHLTHGDAPWWVDVIDGDGFPVTGT